MEFLHASIALLASMVLVLAGMVGWLYWQQTRLFQNMNSIVMVIGELARPPSFAPAEEADVKVTTEETAPVPVTEEDDRVSVDQDEGSKTDVVDGPPAPLDTDGLEGKTKKELTDLLSKRGIPYGKNDSKSVLISLLKATA
jgi:hypothetical protein